MRIKCPECNTDYKINPEKIPKDGTISKCKKCGNFIEIKHPNAAKDEKKRDDGAYVKRESMTQNQTTQRGQIGESRTIIKKGKNLGIGILIFGLIINLIIYFYTKVTFSLFTSHFEDYSWLMHYIIRFGGVIILYTFMLYLLSVVFFGWILKKQFNYISASVVTTAICTALIFFPTYIEYSNLLKEAETLYSNSEYEKAAEALKTVVQIEPDNVDAQLDLGFCYSNLKRYEDAIEAYKSVIGIEPDNVKAQFNLGLSYFDLKRYEDAIEPFKAVIRIEPDNADAQFNLGLSSFPMAVRSSPPFGRG